MVRQTPIPTQKLNRNFTIVICSLYDLCPLGAAETAESSMSVDFDAVFGGGARRQANYDVQPATDGKETQRLCPKWQPIPFIVHYFSPGSIGHYIGCHFGHRQP